MQNFETLPDYQPKKNRDIKVSLDDLYLLFSQVFYMFSEHFDEVSDEDYQEVSIMFNKYLVLSKLRDEETFWHDAMKQLDSSPGNLSKEEYQSQRRSAFEFYVKAKHERELLQKEVNNLWGNGLS